MQHFFRRNQKKLLAIFAAGLMIVFILPFTGNQLGSDDREDPVIGYVDGDKVYGSELQSARGAWDMLNRITIESQPIMTMFRRSPFERTPDRMPYSYQLGMVTMWVERDPELFLLMQKEADRAGIRIPPDRVEDAVRQINPSPNMSADDRERLRHAVTQFLKVKSLYDRVTSNVKVSEPVVVQHLAQNAQEGSLNLVEFSADEFKGAATAPTTQELQAHFDKYKGVPASQPATSPSGLPFGYQLPNRAKVQYLTVPHEQVREAVRKGKDAYDWEVAGRRYYQTHLREFPVTQPATMPTTRPYEQVKDDVLAKVMEPEIDALAKRISAAITGRMTADWQRHAKEPGAVTGPATASSTAPATAPGTQPAGFAAFAYLEQLASDIQKEFGVLPTVVSKAEWLTADELSNLPGIGTARRVEGGDTLANYVLQSAEAFMPVPKTADPTAVLSPLEPSQPLEDADGNLYVFRVTDAQAARPPENLAAVKEQVETDLRYARAYERAQAEAKKLVEAAKKGGLQAAATAAGRKVVETGTIGRGFLGFGPTTIPNYPTTPETRQQLLGLTQTLLTDATPDAPHPVAMVELPEEKRVIVAELRDVSSRIQADQSYATHVYVASQLEMQEAQELAVDWFKPENVKARLNYRSLVEERNPTTAQANAR